MKLLNMYIKQRKQGLFLFAACSLIFLTAFFLYGLPLGAALYPIAVCLILSLFYFAWDFWNVQKKHQKLTELCLLPAELMEELPEVNSLDDEDYQAVIQALRREQNRLQSEFSLKYQDMVDYYTIWVHQIKTPIASMRLTLQSEDTPISRQLSEELQRIEQYVEMVLAFLRLDSSSRDYVFREQELDPIIRDAVRKFAGSFIRKKLQLRYEPIQEKVLTDEKWLSFVIEQVLSNGIKYTGKGSITITMEAPKTLCIRDTGIGIAPEDLPRVFEKSYTGYNGRSDKKASGIGFYLCKRICDNLGHRITIQSSLDEGTVVRIDLDQVKLQVE